MNIEKKQNTPISPRIHYLGKPNRPPLAVCSPVQNLSATVYAGVAPPTIIKSIVANVKVPFLKPPRMIRQQIGQPFEIRIPRAQIQFLERQVKELREKCSQLQHQSERRDIEKTFNQISKSTKLIEEHLETVLTQKPTIQQTKYSEHNKSQCEDSGDEEQFERIIRDLEETSNKITELETKGMELSQTLANAELQYSKIVAENEELRKQIALISKGEN